GFCQRYPDGFLLAQIAHRQLSLLPSEMLIGAARKALIVTFEMVDDDGVFEKELGGGGAADQTDHGKQQRYRGGPFIVLPFGQVSPHRISATKGQDEVNEAKPCSVVSESLYYCARRRSSSALLATAPLPVGADRQRPEDHLLASGVLPPLGAE